eukprot:scaffold7067_cov245-Pinguiococcus_pyrenoidosus.AAC.14
MSFPAERRCAAGSSLGDGAIPLTEGPNAVYDDCGGVRIDLPLRLGKDHADEVRSCLAGAQGVFRGCHPADLDEGRGDDALGIAEQALNGFAGICRTHQGLADQDSSNRSLLPKIEILDGFKRQGPRPGTLPATYLWSHDSTQRKEKPLWTLSTERQSQGAKLCRDARGRAHIKLEGVQVSVVDTDDASPCQSGDFRLHFVGNLDERLHAKRAAGLDEVLELLPTQNGNDEQHGVRAVGPRLEQLVLVKNEVYVPREDQTAEKVGRVMLSVALLASLLPLRRMAGRCRSALSAACCVAIRTCFMSSSVPLNHLSSVSTEMMAAPASAYFSPCGPASSPTLMSPLLGLALLNSAATARLGLQARTLSKRSSGPPSCSCSSAAFCRSCSSEISCLALATSSCLLLTICCRMLGSCEGSP